MTVSKPGKYWMVIIVFLISIIAVGSIAVWSRYNRSQPIEISAPAAPELQGEIYIGGAVSNPGIYPLKSGDSLEALIQSAGGTTGNADPSNIELYISQEGESAQPQKVDLNRAEAWLLQALPGIGETKAQAIIDYRNRNGSFRNIKELLEVKGIGVTTYEQVATQYQDC